MRYPSETISQGEKSESSLVLNVSRLVVQPPKELASKDEKWYANKCPEEKDMGANL